MKQLKRIVLITFVAAAFACSKDDGMENSVYNDAPTFYVSGLLDGDTIGFTAGEQNYALTTDFVLDTDSVLTLRGKLGPADGTPGPSLSIWLRTGIQGISDFSALNVSDEVNERSYALSSTTQQSAIPGEYLVSLFSTSNLATSYQWKLPEGIFLGNAASFSIRGFTEELPISLRCEYTDCSSEITHYLHPTLDCDATFNLTWLTDNRVMPTVVSRETYTPVQVDWYLNDEQVEIPLSGLLLGSYGEEQTLRAEMTFADGCRKKVSRAVKPVPGLAQNCSAEFIYNIQQLTTQNPEQLHTVELIYTDENGKRFTSLHDRLGGQFEIHSTAEYKRNATGWPTKRFTFSANATLLANDGSTIQLNRLFGHFAVAYPN